MTQDFGDALKDARCRVPDTLDGAFEYLIDENCSPRIAAAATLYAAALVNRIQPQPSQKTLAEAFDTTGTSVRKWYDPLIRDYHTHDELLVPEEDRKALKDALPENCGRSPTSSSDLVADIREHADLSDVEELGSDTSLSQEELLAVLEKDDRAELVRHLLDSGAFTLGEDFNVVVNVNKPGLRQLAEQHRP